MSDGETRIDWRPTLAHAATTVGPFLGLIAVFLIFTGLDLLREHGGHFASVATVQKVLRDASLVGVAALGMTLIIIAGGIDLSAGTATAFCATVTAWCVHETIRAVPIPLMNPTHFAILGPIVIWLAIPVGILAGCSCGLVNGVLISRLRVVPFIITLGTMTAFTGAGLILANDTPIRVFRQTPKWVRTLQTPYPVPEWIGVCSGVWLMLALAVAVWVLLRFTVFGRHIYAVGSNEEAARLCGINVDRMRVAVYTLAGVFVGVAGLFMFAELSGVGDPNQGPGKELDYIAAVVIGGGSLSGGRGSVVGTLAGACIMATIRHGCVTLNISSSWQLVILGAIIVAAVTLDQYRQRGSR